MLLTPAERRALLTLVSLLILGQLASIWQEHRRARPDRELSSWLMRMEAVRADTARVASDSVLAEPLAVSPASPEDPAAASAMESLPIAKVEPVAEAPPGLLETGRVRINLASTRDLELLPGIGPAMAKRILEDRLAHGAYRRPEDLLRVKGIGAKTLGRLVSYLDFTSP